MIPSCAWNRRIALVALLASNTRAFSHQQFAPRSFVAATCSSRVSTATTKVWGNNDLEEPETETKSGGFSDEVMAETKDALASVGWARPTDDGEMTSEDPFVKQINDSIQADFGVSLDELLNPAKVVNLERDLYNLRSELASLTGNSNQDDVTGLSTMEIDSGGGGEEAEDIRKTIRKKENSLAIERRSVFRGWLKNIFLGQAVFSLAFSLVMATTPGTLFGGFEWYGMYQMETPIKVLGFWWWWLFIIPSLRSRRPKGAEKKALDIAFLASPLVSLAAPVVTKDTAIIWAANLLVVAASYGYAFAFDSDDDDDSDQKPQPEWLKFIYKSLDFGSGQERGSRQ